MSCVIWVGAANPVLLWATSRNSFGLAREATHHGHYARPLGSGQLEAPRGPLLTRNKLNAPVRWGLLR